MCKVIQCRFLDKKFIKQLNLTFVLCFPSKIGLLLKNFVSSNEFWIASIAFLKKMFLFALLLSKWCFTSGHLPIKHAHTKINLIMISHILDIYYHSLTHLSSAQQYFLIYFSLTLIWLTSHHYFCYCVYRARVLHHINKKNINKIDMP